MANNLQPTYNEYLSPAIVGMRANMEPARVISRLCLPVAGMTMGIVATYGTSDDNARNVASGGSYLGITGLDPTVRPGLTVLPDMYVYQDIMSIYTKGVIWVRAQVNVSPGQAAFYDGNGYLTTVSGAGFATDTITFSANPTVNSTISLNGTTITFVASGATGTQVNIGGSLAATLTALQTMASGSADTQLVKYTYAIQSGTTLVLTAATAGTAANALTVSTTVPGAVAATGTLTGGTSANTAVPNATFDSTATAGGLVKLRLN